MSTNTATVETLTAEVRVLMVGSRQVTLSVFAQLDIVDYGEMEPFGRVRCKTPGTWVVGRRHDDGSLVRCKAEQFAPVWVDEAPDDFTHWIRHQPHEQRSNPRWKVAENVVWEVKPWLTPCDCDDVDIATLEAGWRRGAQADGIWYAARHAMWAEANALPLIVLAGLR